MDAAAAARPLRRGRLTARTALRTTKSPAAELGLLDASIGEEALIEAMIAHPVLVNRPIVCTSRGVRLCRPSEAVLDLLDRWPPALSRRRTAAC